MNTKAIFIDPILLVLGWDIWNLDDVYREYRYKPKHNPVDYALLINRNPCLFIEAKSFEKDLSDFKWISQIIGYAANAGVEWCVLTNGDEYRLYNSHASVDADRKLFRKIKISDMTQSNIVIETLDLLSKDNLKERKINALWKAYFVDQQVTEILENLFKTQMKI